MIGGQAVAAQVRVGELPELAAAQQAHDGAFGDRASWVRQEDFERRHGPCRRQPSSQDRRLVKSIHCRSDLPVRGAQLNWWRWSTQAERIQAMTV